MDERPIYIHYGDDTFREMDPIKNLIFRDKPFGGLWASRKDCRFGWKDWCEDEEFRLDTFDRSFEFKLKDGAKVLLLKEVDQLDDLPKIDNEYDKSNQWTTCNLDFVKLNKDWDAIELTDSWKFHWALYGWDCDSILIMNPDIVEVIERSNAHEAGRLN